MWTCCIVASGDQNFDICSSFYSLSWLQHYQTPYNILLSPTLLFPSSSLLSPSTVFWVNWLKSKSAFVEIWSTEAELLQRVEWIHDQNGNTNKQSLLSCLSTVSTVMPLPLFPPSSLFFHSVVYNNRMNFGRRPRKKWTTILYTLWWT